VLVGTISVEVSELLSRMLKRQNIPHSVLNAKQHQKEAEVVSLAGQPGQVTIATNMAGRGTDIKLGETIIWLDRDIICSDRKLTDRLNGRTLREQLIERPCGLHVIGTERHESRRIDRQLRGRSGRQGDPGVSTFFLSLEDDLMRLFGSERISSIMTRLGAQEGEVLQHKMITKAIERAQRRVEGHNFSIRKHLLEYDNVMNQQREVIYDRRLHALEGVNLDEDIDQMIDEYADTLMEQYADEKEYPENWDLAGLQAALTLNCLVKLDLETSNYQQMKYADFREFMAGALKERFRRKKQALGDELFHRMARTIVLAIIDQKWRDHLYEMDQLKEGIGLRAYGQKDPLVEYKREAYGYFVELIGQINAEALKFIFRAEVVDPAALPRARQPRLDALQTVHAASDNMGLHSAGTGTAPAPPPQNRPQPVHVAAQVGRNDPCPCGSGKKYKKCCGQ
jgi:preprotein translocase subunit SecA